MVEVEVVVDVLEVTVVVVDVLEVVVVVVDVLEVVVVEVDVLEVVEVVVEGDTPVPSINICFLDQSSGSGVAP